MPGPKASPALHRMELTDGELAAVKGYRAAHAKQWAAFDRRVAKALKFAELRQAGESDEAIAKRFKRTTAHTVQAALATAPAALAEYRKRPPATWPADVRRLLGAEGGDA